LVQDKGDSTSRLGGFFRAHAWFGGKRERKQREKRKAQVPFEYAKGRGRFARHESEREGLSTRKVDFPKKEKKRFVTIGKIPIPLMQGGGSLGVEHWVS